MNEILKELRKQYREMREYKTAVELREFRYAIHNLELAIYHLDNHKAKNTESV